MKNRSLKENILFFYEICFFTIYAINQIILKSIELNYLFLVMSVFSGILIIINIKNMKKEKSLLVMFALLTIMIGSISLRTII